MEIKILKQDDYRHVTQSKKYPPAVRFDRKGNLVLSASLAKMMELTADSRLGVAIHQGGYYIYRQNNPRLGFDLKISSVKQYKIQNGALVKEIVAAYDLATFGEGVKSTKLLVEVKPVEHNSLKLYRIIKE